MTTKRKQRAHAQKLLARLLETAQIELVEDADQDELVGDIADELAQLDADEKGGAALGVALEHSREVAEVFIDDDGLEEAAARWMRGVHGTSAATTDDRNLEIEAKLLASPDDELASVYADWLIEHGNPLGELFACAVDRLARRRVLAKHAALWGALAEHEKLLDITWTRTGIGALVVQCTSVVGMEWGRLVAAVLDRPLAAFCRSLSIGPLPAVAGLQFETLLAMVGVVPRPNIRELAVKSGETLFGRANLDVSELASWFAGVERLRILATGLVGAPLRHPAVEQLDLHLSSLSELERALVGAELPRLRQLTLGGGAGHGRVLGVLPDQPWFAKLEQLDVRQFHHTARERLVQTEGTRLAHLQLVT